MTRPASIRVLVVDDSAMFRAAITRALNAEADIQVVAGAANADEARQMLRTYKPDVVTLDLEMPGEDGLSLLRDYMTSKPCPTVVVSGRTAGAVRLTISALEAGAADVVAKPRGGVRCGGFALVCASVRAAFEMRNKGRRFLMRSETEQSAVRVGSSVWRKTEDWPIVIGASTGGVQALGTLLPSLPSDAPPIVVVQHMPEGFTEAFARRLDSLCQMNVAEAKGGEVLRRGLVLIAPGGKRHLVVRRRGPSLVTELIDGDPVCYSRPSVNVLFESMALCAAPRLSAAVLTGMGQDGATGLAAIWQAGGRTFAQDQETSGVFGMPARAHQVGASERFVPLPDMASVLLASVGQPRKGRLDRRTDHLLTKG